jgi:hypothetical protein
MDSHTAVILATYAAACREFLIDKPILDKRR